MVIFPTNKGFPVKESENLNIIILWNLFSFIRSTLSYISICYFFISVFIGLTFDFVKSEQRADDFKECKLGNYKLLDEEWRYHSRISNESVFTDDHSLADGWYRFTKSSFRMLEKDEMFQFDTFNRVSNSCYISVTIYVLVFSDLSRLQFQLDSSSEYKNCRVFGLFLVWPASMHDN